MTTEWLKTVYNGCGLSCILGLTSSHNEVPLITKKRSAQGMVPPPRARSGKGALAPSCCSPHGHDQTSEQMSFFRFSQLAAATSRCNTHLRQNELSQVGVCSTCGGRKPNFGGKNVGKIDNWTKNRRTNKEKKCGSRLAAATSRGGKKGGKM